jgi:hypothetical protein
MSHLILVVLVITACWFGVALAAGIVLGTFMRRASTLAKVREHANPALAARVSVPAERSRVPQY